MTGVEEIAGRLEEAAGRIARKCMRAATYTEAALISIPRQPTDVDAICVEAALLLRTQEARIGDLERALKPLAAMADTTVMRDGKPWVHADKDVLYAGPLTWGDARRAAAVLAPSPTSRSTTGAADA